MESDTDYRADSHLRNGTTSPAIRGESVSCQLRFISIVSLFLVATFSFFSFFDLTQCLHKRFGCAPRRSPLRLGLLVSAPPIPFNGDVIGSTRELIAHCWQLTVTPTTCKALMDAGYEVTVERSTQRIFDGKCSVWTQQHLAMMSQWTNFWDRRGIRQG